MTTIVRSQPTRRGPRQYSLWEWTRAYAVLVLQLPIYAVLWFLATFVRRLPAWLTRKLLREHSRYVTGHPMDFRIPPNEAIPAYMQRWWRVPRNWAMNIYYHIVRRSDDDRALHDHPWWNFSIVLDGGYFEHEIKEGGIQTRTWYGPGHMRFRWHGKKAHRLELELQTVADTRLADYRYVGNGDSVDVTAVNPKKEIEVPATTIFITGPVLRRWGFHAGVHGWIDAYDWDDFCKANGIKSMPMDGGSDAAISDRNHLKRN
jgi:hypothetical protein